MGILDTPGVVSVNGRRGSVTGIADSTTGPITGGLSKLYAALLRRTTTPCRIVFAGSSTTAGNSATTPADRYVDKVIAAIQAAYPSGLGTEQSVVNSAAASFGALSSADGVHGYNAGEGGTNSSTYLTESERTAIGTLNPSAVIHMIGSNDFALGTAPATYKANLLTVLNDLKTKITGPCVHILVQSYERFDSPTHTYPWSAYGDAQREIAEADPDNVVFIDLSDAYYKVGVPDEDPFDLVTSDAIHQGDAGHAFMAETLRAALGIPPIQATSSSSSSTQRLVRLASDTFTGTDTADIVGRTTDTGLGGSPRTWAGTANSVGITSNQAVGGSEAGVWFVGVSEGAAANVEAAVTIKALSSTQTVYLDIHRATVAVSPTPDGYRIGFGAGNTFTLRKRVATVTTTIANLGTYAVNDRIKLRYINGTLEVRKNGTVIYTGADSSVPAAGFAGLAGFGAGTVFGLDDFTVDLIEA